MPKLDLKHIWLFLSDLEFLRVLFLANLGSSLSGWVEALSLQSIHLKAPHMSTEKYAQ